MQSRCFPSFWGLWMPPKCADMLVRRVVYLASLASGVVFFFAYRQWFAWVVLLWLVGLPLLSLAVSLPVMLRAQVRLNCPSQVQMGELAVPELSVQCRLPLPPVRYHMQVKNCFTGEFFLYEPEEALLTDHCGGLEVKPWKVYIYDYMGLFRYRVRKLSGCRVLVLPTAVAAPELTQLRQQHANAWKPKTGGGFAENHDLRLYRPGDDLRHIHWKLAAKTGKLVYREPIEPQDGMLRLSLVLSGSEETLDRKLGRLRWIQSHLVKEQLPFEVLCLTEGGLLRFAVTDDASAHEAMAAILLSRKAPEQAALPEQFEEARSWHIGGGTDET